MAEWSERKGDSPCCHFYHILEGNTEVTVWRRMVLGHLKLRVHVIRTSILKGRNRPKEVKMAWPRRGQTGTISGYMGF